MSDLPHRWTEATLGEISARTVLQNGPSQHNFLYIDISSIDVRSKTVVSPKCLPRDQAPSRAKQNLHEGDVVVSLTRPNLNAVALIDAAFEGSVGSTGLHVIRTVEVLPKFIYYFVQTQHFVRAACETVQGVVYPAIRPKDVDEIRIPIPPLSEQRRIVAEIEKHFTRLNEASTLLDSTSTKLARMQESLLQSEFARASSTSRKLGSICRVVRGASPRPAGDPRYFGGTIPWITVGSITSASGPYLREVQETVTEEGKNRSRFVESETLLLTNSGATLGVPRIALLAGCINDGSVALLDLSYPSKLFLYYFLRTQTKKLRRINQGAAQPNLNTTIVKAIDIPWPSAERQAEIVSEIESRLPTIDQAAQIIANARGHATRLRQAILAKAFSGQLVSQDPNDEPASVLLERIRNQGVQQKPRARSPRKRGAANPQFALQD